MFIQSAKSSNTRILSQNTLTHFYHLKQSVYSDSETQFEVVEN